MNKNQKFLLIFFLIIVLAVTSLWLFHGAAIFTQTQVAVEVQDELEKQLGITRQEWVDQFVWGLDLTLSVIGVSGLITLVFYLREKKKNKREKK